MNVKRCDINEKKVMVLSIGVVEVTIINFIEIDVRDVSHILRNRLNANYSHVTGQTT